MPAERICPICGRPTEGQVKPFCSRRCADVDLGRWLKGDYAIPAEEAGEDLPDSAADPDEDGKGGPNRLH